MKSVNDVTPIYEALNSLHKYGNLWNSNSKSPNVLALFGDFNNYIAYNNDLFICMVHLGDVDGNNFKQLGFDESEW